MLMVIAILPGGISGKEPTCQSRRDERCRFSQEDPLEKGMVIHAGTLACRIPWTEKPGELHWTQMR